MLAVIWHRDMWMRRSLIAAGILGASGGAYGFGYHPFEGPVVTRYALTPEGWPPGLRLRIAVLADLHAGAPLMTASRVADIGAATNALAPDMVRRLGDYGPVSLLVRDPYRPAEIAAILGRLRAPLGGF